METSQAPGSPGEPGVLPSARAALDAGDFGAARRLLLRARRRRLSGPPEKDAPEEIAEIDALLWRLRPDWLAGVLLLSCLLFFTVVTLLTLRP